MAKKFYFVVNPCSANGSTGKWWPGFIARLDLTAILYDWSFTTGPYTAPAIAARAARDGYDIVVAVGGDGTVYEVLNGFLENGRQVNPSGAMAVLPRGTGCDLSRALGIPRGETDLIGMLQNGGQVRIDAGQAYFTGHDGVKRRRYFLNVAEAGLGGETVARVNRTTKVFGGLLSFLAGAVTTIAVYKNRYIRITLDDTEVREGNHTLVACGNGSSFGGGMKICPGAAMDDGYLDVVAVSGMSKPELIANLPRVYGGTHLSHPKVWSRRAKKVRVQSDEMVLINLDGEQPGVVEAEFSILPGAVKLLLPQDFR
ncbi:MAG: diacylglycerol/lipid kinase family protein [Eubacteriales bacterium]